jgi:hypothetical protein
MLGPVFDRLCGLVVRVPGYRSGGPGLDSRALQENVVGLERGPLSLVSTTEKLLGRKSSGSGLESREFGRIYIYIYIYSFWRRAREPILPVTSYLH